MFANRKDPNRFSLNMLQQMRQRIENGDSLTVVAKDNHVSKPKLKELFIQNGIEMPLLKTGPKEFECEPETVNQMFDYKGIFNVGYKRVADKFDVSQRHVYKIFKENSLLMVKNKRKPKIHNKRFVAKYANQLWHSDLHYWKKVIIDGKETKTYLIGFIDDRSRLILHCAIINAKTSALCAGELLCCLQKYPPPAMITIDNGGEFVGTDFQDVLKAHKIKCNKTFPYTPEMNGKIERWWKTLEMAKTYDCTLEDVVLEYNTVWKHSALKPLIGHKATPAFAYETMERWEEGKLFDLDYSEPESISQQ